MRLHKTGLLDAVITLESLVTKQTIESADLIVFCRNTEPRYSHIIRLVHAQRIPYVYDLDDNFFELPIESELGGYHRSPERISMLTQYLQLAGLVRVYSEPLFERVYALNPRIEQVTGTVDWSLILNPTENMKKIRIVYSTARVYDDMTEIILPALSRVLQTYGAKVEVHFWGTRPAGLSSFSNVHLHSLISDYDRFLRRFSQAGFDIGLAPLNNDLFSRSKTNNKFREYGACRVAGIYSDMDVYSNCVTDTETGLLVSNNSGAWYRAIVRLIQEPDLREKIKSRAHDYASEHYPQGAFEVVWWNHIQKVLSERERVLSPTLALSEDSFSPGQRVEMEKAASYDDSGKKSILILIGIKFSGVFRHFLRYGLHVTFWLVRRSLYNYWMVLKLRMLTSSAAKVFRRR